jgi:polar amino acid transport system substrate-binding protein
MIRRLLVLAAVLVAILATFVVGAPARAQTPASSPPGAGALKVGTRIVLPFAFKDADGNLTGFSVDLWNAIAKAMGVTSTFVVANDIGGLLSDVDTGKTDLGIAAISITADRETRFDFSQPMFDGGLRIAVPARNVGDPDPIAMALSFVGSRAFLEIVAGIIVLLLVPAPIIWLVERKSGAELLEAKTPLGQFGQAMWWSVCALGGQAQDMPSRLAGRLVAIPWIMFAVLFSSYFTAAVTTRMTVKQLERGIEGPEDLAGHGVISVAGSTAAAWLRDQTIPAVEVPDIGAALDQLEAGKVQAAVYDDPVLAYYAAHGKRGRVKVTGAVFHPQHYGILFRPGAPERRRVDEALLRLKENGDYQRIKQKWFSEGDN